MRNEKNNELEFEKELRDETGEKRNAGVCPGCEKACLIEEAQCGRGRAFAAGERIPPHRDHARPDDGLTYDDRVPGDLKESAAAGRGHGLHGEEEEAGGTVPARHEHTRRGDGLTYDDRVPGELKESAAAGRGHGPHGEGETPPERERCFRRDEGGPRGPRHGGDGPDEECRRPFRGEDRFHGPRHGEHAFPHGPLQDDGSLTSLLFRAAHPLGRPGAMHGASQDRVLRLLSSRGVVSQRGLQEFLAVQPGSLSELLSKMEAKGLLIRETDAEDRRRTLLRLSTEGKKEAGALSQAEDERRFAVLTAEERETLRSLLQKLADAQRPKHDPFFDEDGKLMRLPGKRRPRFAALRQMAERFETGRDYTEKEVNEILLAGMAFGDAELVRRELIEAGLLLRTGDGSRYWRAEEPNGDESRG